MKNGVILQIWQQHLNGEIQLDRFKSSPFTLHGLKLKALKLVIKQHYTVQRMFCADGLKKKKNE